MNSEKKVTPYKDSAENKKQQVEKRVSLKEEDFFAKKEENSAQEEAQENLEKAQIIDKDEAVEIALENYPLLKNEKRKLEQAEAMKGAAWDLGRTTIFTGGEELNNDRGIYTLVGFQQQQIDSLMILIKKFRLLPDQLHYLQHYFENVIQLFLQKDFFHETYSL